MKYIDPKSLTIGVLAASLVFACTDSNNKTTNSPSLVSEAKAATGVGDKWDDNQEWAIKTIPLGLGPELGSGYEPIAYIPGLTKSDDKHILYRKRIK